MNVINKNITEIDFGIIVSQVNCRGVMGSGLAKSIREKWPIVYTKYKNYGDLRRWQVLGEVLPVKIKDNLYICNIFGQFNYGNDGKRYTSYGAWEIALPKLKNFVDKVNLPLYFPMNIGSFRGGGNFIIISEMIKEHFPEPIFCAI